MRAMLVREDPFDFFEEFVLPVIAKVPLPTEAPPKPEG